MDSICGGELPKPEPHDGDFNTHRVCTVFNDEPKTVLDLQVNKTDLDWFRWVYDALDGEKTSWLSNRNGMPS